MQQSLELDRLTFVTLVINGERDTMFSEQVFEIAAAASRQRDVFRKLFGAGDDPRRDRRRQPHAVPLVEFWVLEGGEPLDLVQQ